MISGVLIIIMAVTFVIKDLCKQLYIYKQCEVALIYFWDL